MSTMVITCESCGARFRLDSDKLNKPRNKVRCSKCKSVFVVEQPEENDLVHIEISEEEGVVFPVEDSEDEDKFEVSAPESSRPQAGSSRKKLLVAAIVAIPLIVIIGLIIGLSNRFSLFNAQKSPAVAVKPDVTISDNVTAYYLENMHTGEVLVIEGKVLNKSSKPVSFVMVEGKLFNRKDIVVLTQRCYAGNPLTRAQITHLQLSQIEEKMMNREGHDLKDVRIPPSGEAPFLLVFHDLPEINTLSNYSVNVVSSKID